MVSKGHFLISSNFLILFQVHLLDDETRNRSRLSKGKQNIMKIALIGYGKMGKTIETLAQERGHEIAAIIDPARGDELSQEIVATADVAIEFTRPEAAVHNISSCIQWGIPIISGTTGWLEHLPEIKALLDENPESAFFYASNYSLGVNVFFELNKRLAQMMNPLTAYDVEMEEIHHTQKLDAPSGTGITLAEGVIDHLERKANWVNETATKASDISLISKRIADVPGTHSIKYSSEVDDIEIIHTAHSRKGFALGAIIAAEWSIGKSGLLSMKQMLNF